MNTNDNVAQAGLPQYKCHKEVWALKIKEVKHTMLQPEGIADGGLMIPENPAYSPIQFDAKFLGKHNPKAGDYYVQYADGYTSMSPAKAFEDGYSLKDPALGNLLYCNDARNSMLWRESRGLDSGHLPYTPDDVIRMYRPYLENFDHDGLEPREIRLLEAFIRLTA